MPRRGWAWLAALALAGPPAVSFAQGGHVHAPPGEVRPAGPVERAGEDSLVVGDAIPAPNVEEPRVPIAVAPEQQSRIGLKTAAVERRPIEREVRTVGIVAVDERREAHVHTRAGGWIEEILVNYVGSPVEKGEILCRFYSPELVAIQEEYIAARGRGGVAGEVADSALERLRRLGVPASELGRLERGDRARLLVPIQSPIDGYVVAKEAIQGMYVTPDMRLYHIADLANLWVLATLYEYDLPLVKEGDEALVTLTYEPARRFEGRITYVYPEVDPETRTVKARVEVQNPDLYLKPGMYVNVAIDEDLGRPLVVPDTAVIDTGARKLVFVWSAVDRFEPREVELGPKAGDLYSVTSGLAEGEVVVTSANFLIDAESRLQAALEKGLTAPGGHSGHGGGASAKPASGPSRLAEPQ